MELYFLAAKVLEKEKVSITTMYLTGDAKLWCRTRVQDNPKINMWKSLKKEMTDQFMPCNLSWVAREALKRPKHTTTVMDYVKQFMSLMMDIPDMLEANNIFNFLSSLQA